jgi:hypothetical protein
MCVGSDRYNMETCSDSRWMKCIAAGAEVVIIVTWHNDRIRTVSYIVAISIRER